MKNWWKILALCSICILTTTISVACGSHLGASSKDESSQEQQEQIIDETNQNEIDNIHDDEQIDSPTVNDDNNEVNENQTNQNEDETTTPTEPTNPETPTTPEEPTPIVTPHQHQYGEWQIIESATCTKEGLEAIVCSECGERKTRPIAQLSHNYIGTTTKAPTCQPGVITYTCQYCGDSYQETIPATEGHDDVITEKVDPTCVSAGYTTYQCQKCNHCHTVEIPATGKHDFDESTHHCIHCGIVSNEPPINNPINSYWKYNNWVICFDTFDQENKTGRYCSYQYIYSEETDDYILGSSKNFKGNYTLISETDNQGKTQYYLLLTDDTEYDHGQSFYLIYNAKENTDSTDITYTLSSNFFLNTDNYLFNYYNCTLTFVGYGL